jgi:hypothetical protein
MSAGRPALSRRSLMLALAASTAAPAVRDAQAQADGWREYRREDLGFRIEMPGVPEIEEETGDLTQNMIRSINATVEVDDTAIIFGVTFTTYKAVAAETWFKLFREGLSRIGAPITETPITINGFPGRELVIESETIGGVYRTVVMDDATVTAAAIGDRRGNPAVARFLDSFTLLRGVR